MTSDEPSPGTDPPAPAPNRSPDRPRVVIAAWTVTSLVAALTAYIFSGPDPGARAAVWYFAIALLSAVVVVAARWLRSANQPGIVVALSLVTTVVAAVHLFFVVERVYSGLTALVLVLAAAGSLAAVRWARGSASES